MAKEWYGVRTFNGYEQKVIDSLKRQIEKENMGNLIDEIYLPAVKKYSFVRSKLKQKEELLFPGYFFVRMEMTNETLFFVRGVQYVIGYAGISSMKERPSALDDYEVDDMKKEASKIRVDLKIGDKVCIVNHDSYNEEVAKVKDINPKAERVTVVIDKLLGEQQIETLSFLQIEKY